MYAEVQRDTLSQANLGKKGIAEQKNITIQIIPNGHNTRLNYTTN